MLLVISDLHFEEEASDRIDGAGGAPPVAFQRNLSPDAFRKLAASLKSTLEPGRPLDIVLAGDIFDLHRTTMWFADTIRPFDDPAGFTSGTPGEAKVLGILEAIAAEPRVSESLAEIRAMTGPPLQATIHYLPGNHDRLANATATIRERVRQLLGAAPSPDPFPHHFVPVDCDPPVLVRHGHEYDRYNFSVDHEGGKLPLDLPSEEYESPAFGDFMTVEVASRLPALLRTHYSDERILADDELRGIYRRLHEFDDVRPQSALVEFLLRTPGTRLTEKRVWKLLEPVVRELLDTIAGHPFLRRWLKRLEKRGAFDLIDLVQAALATRIWHAGLPLSLVRRIAAGSREAGSTSSAALVPTVAKEQAVTDESVRAVIAGHTHEPQVALLGVRNGAEQYYIDTGTWRNRVPATPDQQAFGRLKALTYVLVYGRNEDLGKQGVAGGKTWSFDYWSGFTQRW